MTRLQTPTTVDLFRRQRRGCVCFGVDQYGSTPDIGRDSDGDDGGGGSDDGDGDGDEMVTTRSKSSKSRSLCELELLIPSGNSGHTENTLRAGPFFFALPFSFSRFSFFLLHIPSQKINFAPAAALLSSARDHVPARFLHCSSLGTAVPAGLIADAPGPR